MWEGENKTKKKKCDLFTLRLDFQNLLIYSHKYITYEQSDSHLYKYSMSRQMNFCEKFKTNLNTFKSDQVRHI